MQAGWERRRAMEAAIARAALKSAPRRHPGTRRQRALRTYCEAAERAEEDDLLLLAKAATTESDELRWAATEALRKACVVAARRSQAGAFSAEGRPSPSGP